MRLFISDLHLCDARPATTAAFHRFLRGPARDAAQLWILGDLFEYWTGDDDLDQPFNAEIADALHELSNQGVALHFVAGNRDFLLGPQMAARCGMQIQAETVVLDDGDTPTLLMHGDSLCTDDSAYQQFRSMVRDPAWQAQFLAQPQAQRRQIAQALRMQSEQAKQGKAAEIMDVNPRAVAACLREHRVSRLIHGHTHRPAFHRLEIDGRLAARWVLADWHDDAPYLAWDGSRLEVHHV